MQLSLYDIKTEYQTALQTLDYQLDGEDLSTAEKQALIDASLAPLSDQFDQKAFTIAAYIANSELALIGIKTVELRMTQRRKALEHKIEFLKRYLLEQMQDMKRQRISNDSLVVAVRQNPAKVIIENEDLIPPEYQKQEVITSILKSVIAADIKRGKTINGAYLQSSSRLSIK